MNKQKDNNPVVDTSFGINTLAEVLAQGVQLQPFHSGHVEALKDLDNDSVDEAYEMYLSKGAVY
jgi:hypothetical protein